MKTVEELLSDLNRRDVKLWIEGDRLHYSAPKGIFTPELRAKVAESKSEIITFLKTAGQQTAVVPAPDHRYEPFPLNDIQQAYWVGQSGAFELSITPRYYFEVESSDLDPKHLSEAWQQLILRHELLRTVFLPTGEQQILEQVPDYEIEVLDLRRIEPVDVIVELAAVRNQMCHRELPSHQWPLFEVRASHLDNQRLRLHFSFNVLIIDGRSLQILMRELAQLCKHPQTSLTPLELSSRDYILATLALRESPKFQQSLNYWHKRIPNLPPAPELPLEKQPGTLSKYQFTHLSVKLEPNLWHQFQNYATKAGLTPTLALCAAYAEVLAVWSKNPRFTLTILYFNRPPLHPQANDIVGNFSTTVLLEVDCSTFDSFVTRAKRLQTQFWNDLEHIIVSGVQVVRELNRFQGDIPRATMPVTFTSMASTLKSSTPVTTQNPPEINHIDSHLQIPQVFLDHQVLEDANEALVLNWDFVKEIFPPGLVEEMLAAYFRFLHRLATEEDSWQEISPQLIPPTQLQQQVSINSTEGVIEEKLLHTLFTAQVSKRPDQVAVFSSTCTLTYKEVYERSHHLAHQLRQLGVHSNQLVAVVMEKGWEQVVGVLAILMAGSAYVPIDPGLPQERCWQLLEQSEVHKVLTQSWLDEAISYPEGIQRIFVDMADAASDHTILESVQQSTDLAYVIYTSGSTGVAKGVMIDHRGAVNTIVDINQRFSISSDDKVLALSSLSFDLSVYDIFGTLAAGGTIVLPDAAQTKEPAHWLDLVEQQQVTIWNSVPALMQILIEYAVSTQVKLSSLRLVMLSGDWLPLSLPSGIKTLIDGVQVISLGGATEASIWSILYPIETVDPTWKSIPYGRPMVNQRVYVLNEKLNTCPFWVPGHLYIGGIGLAKGYWKNEEKTRASFIIHPRTGERLYRTGDLGRYLSDGNIEFLGREDFQVKVQGYRIECGEIEAMLLQHPTVQAVVVTTLGELQGDKFLVAYVVPKSEAKLTPSELRDFLGQKLPPYMVPSNFMMLEALPLSANGKIDRRALPMPNISSLTKKAGFVLPRNPLELQLAQIWSEILEVQSVGVQDNFFELGGYSFSAMRLMARIQQQFCKTLPLATLVQNPTIEHLANLLHSSTNAQTSSPLITIQPSGTQSPFFCIHPVGGNVLCYQGLARYLGSEQPFYGLQAVGLYGEEKPLTRIEDMAAHYIEAIQPIQPQGPYYLGGWSLGGIVAFEMAQQLYQQGHEVGLLALIDSYAPTVINKPKEIDDAMLVTSVAQDLGSLFGKELLISVDELRQIQPEEQLKHVLEQAKMLNILPSEVDLLQMHHLLQVFKANTQALHRYIRRPYPGRITLFCSSQQVGGINPAHDWAEEAAGGIEVQEIPGDHYTIVQEPQVQVLAEYLAASLNKARSRLS